MTVRECEVTALARELLRQPTATRSRDDLVVALEECETAMRVMQAAQLRVIAEIERKGIPPENGARTTKAFLQKRLRISGPDADVRVKLAHKVEGRVGPDGQPLPPELPATAAALWAGTIGLDHARVVADGIRKVTGVLSAQQCQQAEELLVEQSRVADPHDVRSMAERLRYHFDQEGAFREEERQFEDRELHFGVARDGMTVVKGRLDRETGAKLHAVLEPLAAPRPEQDGEKDPRTAAQRNADALADLLDIALSTDHLPRAGGQRPHLIVTMSWEGLQQRLSEDAPEVAAGVLESTGQLLSASRIRLLACDAQVLPVVLGGEGQPLDVGRAERTAPPQIRAALLARDGRCAFPNCDLPPGTPAAHHVRHWVDGGETSLANMVMLCSRHHRMVHNQGWCIDLTSGRPVFREPSTVDPWRRPRPGNRPLHQLHLPPLIAS